jgi:hypothetical protein
MVKNVVAYFYPNNLYSVARALVFLDGMPTESREVILSNMRKASSLTLEILRNLEVPLPPDQFSQYGRGLCSNLL